MMKIPYTALSDEALRNLVQEFVLREGTDYGEHEVSLDTKIAHVISQLKKGSVVIVYDDYLKSCSIVPEGQV